MTLRISRSLSLSTDFVTKTVGILAQRRVGKTFTASVLAEELFEASLPFVALDPTGAWWGLRTSANGERPGLPVVIFGGQHGDVPLERTAGKVLADLVVDEPGYYVFDFSLFESGAAEKQFATDFALRLYRRKGQAGKNFPLHLFVDEANRFVPQRITDRREADAAMLGAFEAIVLRGGLRGLGTTLVSQRAAVVNKNVLEQVDMLIVLRVVGPNDRKAIDEYVKANGTEEQRAELLGSLASLKLGEAWVWEPGSDPPLFERVQIRERHTFNSSATPKAGGRLVTPKVLAAVDLERLRGQIEATLERAKADDPEMLRMRVATLERALREAEARPAEVERVEVSVPIPFLDPEFARTMRVKLGAIVSDANTALKALRAAEDASLASEPVPPRELAPRLEAAPQAPERPRTSRRHPPVLPAVDSEVPDGDTPTLKKGARHMLAILARHHPLRVTRAQLATLAGFSVKGGTFQNYFGALKRAGYFAEVGGEVWVTPEGLAASGVSAPAPMTTYERIEMWRGALKAGAREMLDVLVTCYPAVMTRDDLAKRVGMEPSGGTFQTYLSTLRRNGLAEVNRHEVRAGNALFIGESGET
jgi:hypothetical protein